jgi:hypothetical protein
VQSPVDEFVSFCSLRYRARPAWADPLIIIPPGANASEASAVVKQIKFFHGDGYTSEELADFRQIIWKSLLENSRNIVQALRTSGLEPTDHTNKVRHLFYTFSVPRHGRVLLDRQTASTL